MGLCYGVALRLMKRTAHFFSGPRSGGSVLNYDTRLLV